MAGPALTSVMAGRISCSSNRTPSTKTDAVKAAVSVSSEQVIVDGGFVDQHFRRHGGVLEGLRHALGHGRRAGVRAVADQHDPGTVPGRWDQGLAVTRATAV